MTPGETWKVESLTYQKGQDSIPIEEWTCETPLAELSYIVTTDPKDFAVLQLSSQEGPFTISLHAVQDERGVTTSSVGYQTLHYYTLRTLFGGCKSKFLEIAAEDPTQHSHLVRLISAAEKEIASRLPTKM